MRSFKPLVVVALLSCAAAGVRAQQQFTLLASIVDPATNASPEKIDAGELRVLEDGVTGKVLRVDAVDRVVKVQVLVDNGAGVGSESIADLRKGLRGLKAWTSSRPIGPPDCLPNRWAKRRSVRRRKRKTSSP